MSKNLLVVIAIFFCLPGCDETMDTPPECDTPRSECILEEVQYTEIPNLSLDEWIPYGTAFHQPWPSNFWITPNEASEFFIGGPSVVLVTGDEAYQEQGTAAKLTSRATMSPIQEGLPVVAGYIISGRYTADLTNPLNALRAGRPFQRRISTVSGYFKYFPEGNDVMLLSVVMRTCTPMTDDCGNAYTVMDTIGTALMTSDATTDRYTRFELQVDYDSESTLPDDVILYFCSSANFRIGGGSAGSTLYLDALEVTYQ